MPLNKQKGNMYSWISHTWNTVKGECEHDCSYCYMKSRGKLNPVRFDEKELNTDLEINNKIFVGSSNDIFSESIPDQWIKDTLLHCMQYPGNEYFFQTKNVERIFELPAYLPSNNCTIGTTIETNRHYRGLSKAPSVEIRANLLGKILDKSTYLTIEPIIDFDLEPMIDLVIQANPGFINIGADSKGNGLPEPSREKVDKLIDELSDLGFEIKLKSNLNRLK